MDKDYEDSSLELLRKMLEIYSPSGRESDLASFLREEFSRIGFERVWTDEVGNVYGEVGSDSPSIMLCGHMDTVPGRLAVRVNDGRVYGRGAVDAKSSLAAMVSASSKLMDSLETGRLVIAGVVDEEGRAKGIRHLIKKGFKVDCAVFGEPSGVKNITFAYKGRLFLEVTFRTVTRHVGAQHLAENAVEKGFEFWTWLKSASEGYKSTRGIFYSLTPCLIGIKSQRMSGGVPDLCRLNVDIRLPPGMGAGKGLEIVDDIVEGLKAKSNNLLVSVKVKDKVDPFVSPRDNALMRALKEAIVEVTGGPVKFLRKTGTGDMNLYGQAAKVPVATYGPGDASLSHTSLEFVEVKDYLASIDVYEKTVKKILEGASNPSFAAQ